MLTFLNSAVLIGVLAVAIPILIHLFTRQKIKIVNFSSLRFLKELQKQKIRRLKIRQILLLILRALLILMLILAFSRPALKNAPSASLESGAQLTAVIILDNTLSMGLEHEGRMLLEVAKKRALEIVNLMRPGDELYLLYPGAPPVFAHDGAKYNLDSMKELIENTELAYTATDYIGALSLAFAIMSGSKNINKEIYLIGDLQKNGLKKAVESDGGARFGEDVNLFLLPVSSSRAENLTITNVRIGNQILEKGKVIEVDAVIKNNSQQSVKNKLVHLFVNGKRVGQNAIDLEANASTKVVFRLVPDRTGRQSGFVLLEDDGLVMDNRRYFTFNIPDEIPVLMVGNHESDTYFLRLALSPDDDLTSYIKAKSILTPQLSQESLDAYKMIILSNVARLDYVEASKLQKFVADGGGLLVFLGADVDLRNYNENLHKKLNLPLLAESITSENENQFLSLGKIDFSHPIFKDVFEDEKNVVSPHFRFAVSLKAEKSINTIMEFSNGAPFLFEASFQNGRIMYSTSGIVNDWSDLALRGIFVPLVNRSVSYLAGTGAETKDEFLIGEELTFNPESQSFNPDMNMVKPDGNEVKIKPEVLKGQYFLQFVETDLPGIYQIVHKDKSLAQWAVNFDPSEAEITMFDPEELQKITHPVEWTVIKNQENVAGMLTESRFGRELWKYFAGAALLLLVAEMLLFREKAEV